MTAPKREEFSMPGLAPPVSHYCDAVRFGDLLFVSGMVGVDADGKVVATATPRARPGRSSRT